MFVFSWVELFGQSSVPVLWVEFLDTPIIPWNPHASLLRRDATSGWASDRSSRRPVSSTSVVPLAGASIIQEESPAKSDNRSLEPSFEKTFSWWLPPSVP